MLHKPKLILSLLALPWTLLIASAPCADLTVNVHDVHAQIGKVGIALIDSQAAWDDKAPPVHAMMSTPAGDMVQFVFKNLSPGSYAVRAMHDENGNGKLDTNLMGMPLEAYGISNNPRVMRKPTWEEARFELGKANSAIDIGLR